VEIKTVRVLGLAGSPRRHGNTEVLLDRFLVGAEQAGAQVEKVVVSRLAIAGCVACDGCWEQGVCVVKDDFHAVNRALVESDVIALAAPLFFWSVPAQVKALIDRAQSQWAREVKARKALPPTLAGHERRRGVFISVGGASPRHFVGAVRTVRAWLDAYEADYWARLLYHHVDDRGDIEKHPTALQEAFELGRRAVEEAW
jgi:putative NADPH-quinone reductase